MRKTGDCRIIFVSRKGLYNHVVQRFSETAQANYHADSGNSGYWLTEMPVKIDFNAEPVTTIRNKLSTFLCAEDIKTISSMDGESVKTKFVIPEFEQKQPYFSIPLSLSNKNVIFLHINAVFNTLPDARLYATNQIILNHLWAITGMQLFINDDQNQVEYLMDTSITSALRGKAISNQQLEDVMLTSIKECQ